MRNPERKREKEKERKQQKGTHGLSFVPGKASVDVDRESGCEVNGGDAETRREGLECPISCPTRYPHLSPVLLRFSISGFLCGLYYSSSLPGLTQKAPKKLSNSRKWDIPFLAITGNDIYFYVYK